MAIAAHTHRSFVEFDDSDTTFHHRHNTAMGTTKNTQKQAKSDVDDKLALAQPTRQILEDLAIACAKSPSPDNTFQYAFCLSKSTEPSELRYAVSILDGLVKEGYEHQIDCMYGASCALYLLGEYDKARVSVPGVRCKPPAFRCSLVP
jgi:ferredoxin